MIDATSSSADRLVMTRGESTPLSATLYFQLPSGAPDVGGELTGRLRGPLAPGRRLLSAEYPLVDLGPGPSRLARAVVPDPCYWSPDLPAVYETLVEWSVNGQAQASWTSRIALRRQGTRRRSLHLEGQRWVLRGIRGNSIPSIENSPWDDWRVAGAVAVVNELSDARLQAASEVGARLAVLLDGPSERAAELLWRWTRWPAVVACSVPSWDGDESDRRAWRQAASGAWIFQRCTDPSQRAAWSDGAWVALDANLPLAESLDRWKACLFPVVVERPLPSSLDFVSARQAIDQLQSDLAASGDFAGYVV